MDLRGPSLVLVADGARARLFEERRRGGALVEITDRLGDLTETRPGKAPSAGATHQRIGPASHAGDARTAAEKGEAAFLRRVAARAETVARAADYEDLVVIAPARALGRLRRGLGDRVGLTESADRVVETADALRRRLSRLRAEA